ncbi:Cysteine--tRNA ligase [bioreactor metagenome]|uniref:Cysteine--tRNA ligase n=1 Tax=bioreactor metagenome TaxID=1076179 RepID=A0A644WY30_9ZZZZ
MLSAQYRSPINYSKESLTQARSALDRLYSAADSLDFLAENGKEGALSEEEAEFIGTFDGYRTRFDESMDDDLNTADAIGVLFELVRQVNIRLEGTPTKAFAKACRDMIGEFTNVLGLLYHRKTGGLDSQVEAMIEERQAARKSKNFAEADRIRNALADMGVELMDTPQGVKWKKK